MHDNIIQSSYDQLENNFVDRLSPLSSGGIEVELMPETELQKAFVNPRITVSYFRSEFDDQPVKGEPKSTSIGIISLNEYAETMFNIQVRKLRGAKGMSTLFEDLRKLLLGYQPQNWGRTFFKAFEFVEKNEDNVFYYALTVINQRNIFQAEEEGLKLINSDNLGYQEVAPAEPPFTDLTLNQELITP